jgi:hypothetical protein
MVVRRFMYTQAAAEYASLFNHQPRCRSQMTNGSDGGTAPPLLCDRPRRRGPAPLDSSTSADTAAMMAVRTLRHLCAHGCCPVCS